MSHKIRWTSQKIAQRLSLVESLVYRRSEPLAPFHHKKLPNAESAPPIGREIDHSWQPIPPNSYWGEWQTSYVLRSELRVSAEFASPIALFLPIGDAGDFSHPEALVYIDGEPFAACDRHHQEILLPARFCGGETHSLTLHAWTGLQGWFDHDEQTKLFMRECAVVEIDQATRDFAATARVALGVAEMLGEHEPAKGRLLNGLDAAFRQIDLREPFGDAFYATIPAAHETLRAAIAQAGAPLDVDLICAGHAHIDVAWLWTLGQTRRKSGRSFHTVLRLMEQFPDYQFTQSQPQLYDYVSQDYPELFEGIKRRVAEGRWEPTGGMWVEADCNLSGGESLARQFLLGRTYFKKQFGPDAESPILWLPDVFGYAWNLPQLIKQAGLDYFFTIKISWNQYNRMPYDSFWWQGLDGTKVLTHFSTTQDDWAYGQGELGPSTYNAQASPLNVHSSWRNSQHKGSQRTQLMAFGYGDGGGGPTREMLENIREMGNFPATPRTRHGKAIDFFRTLEAESGDALPTWNGELYLEYHRGTYTTQARNKRANRKSEFLLHDAEFLATLATVIDPEAIYPHDKLRKAWELVCLNQFHDIIPGSSIAPVYTESLEQYEEVRKIGELVKRGALGIIGRTSPHPLLLVNPTSFARVDLAHWSGRLREGERLEMPAGQVVVSQAVEDGTLIAQMAELPPYSVCQLTMRRGAAPQLADVYIEPVTATDSSLESARLLVEVNENGELVRVYDKFFKREVLAGLGNQFQAFEDRPMQWDAWDIDIFYDDKMWLAEPATSVRVVENGPLRATIEVRKRILNSTITQRISLTYNSTQIDFHTTIDWREKHILLKAAFPVAILAPTATYEIQWGNVERPTHRNTSWDWARFETCAQKWVDLSEGGYGVSLLNDCKYGYDIRDNVMRITLLRSPTHPDRHADEGVHSFTYSLLPHQESWRIKTIEAAYALNDPLTVWENEVAEQNGDLLERPLVDIDRSNAVVETVKRAEDGDGIIVRLYEAHRSRGKVTLTTAFELDEVWETNLLEKNERRLEHRGRQVTLAIKPYQIVTLRLK